MIDGRPSRKIRQRLGGGDLGIPGGLLGDVVAVVGAAVGCDVVVGVFFGLAVADNAVRSRVGVGLQSARIGVAQLLEGPLHVAGGDAGDVVVTLFVLEHLGLI